MSNEGPTTVGSIDAKLTVDDSDFKRGMAEAKADAKEVGDLKPEVKVDANVGPALAKLDAVKAAERDLDVAFQRTTIAQEKLDAVTKKYGEDSIQAASARLALTRATNAESDADTKRSLALHQSALEQAKSTAETDKGTESTKRATQANNQRVSGLQVLLALSPAIVTAAAPVAAAAVGLGAAFGVMAVTGALAIKGIKEEMASGTTVGNTYAAGLGVLKTDLDHLATTSANAMLGSFSTAVGDINTKMPFLTQITGQYAGLLGQIGGTALRGVLDGLQQMNPLLQAGGVELGNFVTWLTSFTGTSGFQDFINYAIENLPSVMHLIENLVTTAGHILAAFAPLGPVVIGFLNGLTDVINSLPLPVLAGLVTTVMSVAPAFRIAGTALGWFGVEANLAVPVVGILTAAIAGIGVMAATAAQGTDQGTQAFQDYTQALKDDNNALGEHVRLQAAKALADAGAFDAARTLGVSQQTLTDALMGGTDAQNTLNDAIKRGKDFMNDQSQGYLDGTSNVYMASDAQDHMGKAIETVTKTLDTQRSSIQRGQQINTDMTASTTAQTTALQDQAAQYGMTVAQYQAATGAQQTAATQLAQTTANMQLQNDAAGLLKQAWDKLNGKTISAAEAQNAFDSSLANMGDHVTAAGTKIHFTTTSITDMSSASVSLRGQLIGQVTNLERVIETHGGLQNATVGSIKKYTDMRQQIIDNAVAHGVEKTAAEKYIGTLMQIPKSVKTQLEMDKSAADAALTSFKAYLATVAGKRFTSYIDIITNRIDKSTKDPGGTGSSVGGRANGSLAGGAATGGLIHPGFSASSPAYLSEGGSPFVPRGTDTVPAMLTPGEIVMKRASVQSIGAGTLLEANRTGKLPAQAASSGSTEQITVQITAPDKATAKDYFDEVRFQLRQRNRGGALA